MIQKFTLYRVSNLPDNGNDMESCLQCAAFLPTTPSQEHSSGFHPPRGQHHSFVEIIDRQWIAKLVIETRKVPAAALRNRVDEYAAKIEADTGRKPGKKERKALKEDALMALLPNAFPKQVAVPVWIDPRARLLVIGATSQGIIDDTISCLLRAIPELVVAPLVTKISPVLLMSRWLTEGLGDDDEIFDLGRECELQSADEDRAVVRYNRHDLHGDEVRQHVAEGKLPKRLAIEWLGRASFRLSDNLAIDKVRLLDIAIQDRSEDADAFDADVTIYTAELSALVADLIDVLGGEVQNDIKE